MKKKFIIEYELTEEELSVIAIWHDVEDKELTDEQIMQYIKDANAFIGTITKIAQAA